ncbi:MAG: hypothetical protein KatS3mg068_0347 [Candidatus Sericytochromatia bacterium]|nr:MAG: hypothetical protein KatS3mg068_0347 [Candidatus Sericytochromatia bacterium]
MINQNWLERYRLGIYYLVAIDGTELYRFSERHCQNCLYQKINDQRQYFHRVLEAKIVTSNGLAISLATEFIENKEDKEFDKQDCELKAFYRLEKKIKKLFPRLKICLLLDALYANANVIRICKENDWKYIITFKEGNLKTVWEDFNGLFVNRETAIGAKITLPEINYKETMYRWINEIEYSGYKINILAKYFNQELVRAFITNLKIDENNLFKIETHGQLRWKIENQGFDCQKNHGYNLEHLYTKNPNGIKVVYLLIQIAHIINQLFLKADILKVCSNALSTKALSIKYIFSKILDGILLGWINEFELIFKKLDNRKFQLRFNTS